VCSPYLIIVSICLLCCHERDWDLLAMGLACSWCAWCALHIIGRITHRQRKEPRLTTSSNGSPLLQPLHSLQHLNTRNPHPHSLTTSHIRIRLRRNTHCLPLPDNNRRHPYQRSKSKQQLLPPPQVAYRRNTKTKWSNVGMARRSTDVRGEKVPRPLHRPADGRYKEIRAMAW
jgi:hypothetical protein